LKYLLPSRAPNTSRVAGSKDAPNQGIRRSLKNSARAALMAGVILALLNLTCTVAGVRGGAVKADGG